MKQEKTQTPIHEEGKFTKGEWGMYYPPANQLSELADHFTVCIKNDPLIIAKIPIHGKNLEEAEANAALIADAPDMRKYINYVNWKVSCGGVPINYEEWKEIGKPDFE